MMRTYTVQTRANHFYRYRIEAKKGFTFAEFIVVIIIVSLFITMAMMRLAPMMTKHSFKNQIQDFISTMQMAASAAAESDKRYEIIVDLTEQTYMLRQVTNPDLDQILDEEIITFNRFNNNCQMLYVVFDDLVAAGLDNENYEYQAAKFRAGRTGWQNGAKIVFIDNDENYYSVVVNRISRLVKLREGDVALLMPKEEQDVFF